MWSATIDAIGEIVYDSPVVKCSVTFTNDDGRSYKKVFEIDKSAPNLSGALSSAMTVEFANLDAEDKNHSALYALAGQTVKPSV